MVKNIALYSLTIPLILMVVGIVQAQNSNQCTDDTYYCEDGRKIHKNGGYYDPSHGNADSNGCVYAFDSAGSCGSNSPISGVSSKLITGVQLPSGDTIERLLKSDYSGVQWVKFQYPWANGREETLDKWIDKATGEGYKVLLSVAKKPKNIPNDEGFEEFGRFMEDLARHEGDRVRAYEIWNEPNISGEWEGFSDPDPERYIKLLKYGAEGVKKGNPNAIVISAALAPLAGGKDYDDEKFFKEFISLGGLKYVDAIGWHSNVVENIPPDNSSLRGFQRVRLALGQGKPVWITEFGWNRSLAGIDAKTHGEYIKKAFEVAPKLGSSADGIQAMFIWNFGFGKEGNDPDFMNWDIEGQSTYASNTSLTSKKKNNTEKRLDYMEKYLKNVNKITADVKTDPLKEAGTKAKSLLASTIIQASDCIEKIRKGDPKRTECKGMVKKNYKKAAASYRLVKYYAILAKRPKTCVEADFGMDPKVEAKGITQIKERDKNNKKETGKSKTSRLYLCTGADGKIKWRVHPENSKVLLRIADGTIKIGDTLSRLNLSLDLANFPFKENLAKARTFVGL